MQYLMYVAYTVYVIAAVFMIGAILLQEGKGGGLSALGGTQAESAFGASNPIRRMTVVLAILFFLLAGFLSFMSSRPSLSPGVEEPAAEVDAGAADAGDADAGDAADAASDAAAADDAAAGGDADEAADAGDAAPAGDAAGDAAEGADDKGNE